MSTRKTQSLTLFVSVFIKGDLQSRIYNLDIGLDPELDKQNTHEQVFAFIKDSHQLAEFDVFQDPDDYREYYREVLSDTPSGITWDFKFELKPHKPKISLEDEIFPEVQDIGSDISQMLKRVESSSASLFTKEDITNLIMHHIGEYHDPTGSCKVVFLNAAMEVAESLIKNDFNKAEIKEEILREIRIALSEKTLELVLSDHQIEGILQPLEELYSYGRGKKVKRSRHA